MQPAIINGATEAPGQPKGWDSERSGAVSALFIRREVDGGVPWMRSAWDAEQKEIGLLLAGAKVVLGVAGVQHPVVNMRVAELPDDFEPVITARRYKCPNRGAVARVEGIFALPPDGLRVWSECPIVSTFADAFAAAMAECEKFARDAGVRL